MVHLQIRGVSGSVQSCARGIFSLEEFLTTESKQYKTDWRSQITKGIWVAKCVGIEPGTIAMDLEGIDGRERGLYTDKHVEQLRKVMVATVRCEEITNEKLSHLTSYEGWLELDEVVQAVFVSGFGEKLSYILDTYISSKAISAANTYDSEAIYFDESVSNFGIEGIAFCASCSPESVETSTSQICVQSSILEFDQGCADASVK
ncbi:hypothetical protein MKW98_019580 [Papaver atlanticum]|uniref:Uncharacterized protein n=1 Tax=Papaver atlanticum TaxID=357466 RepID=A0AAD4S8J9_9MAGN|nr:hypothetical protein MKW98_019580 [Papaver atlanticum]